MRTKIVLAVLVAALFATPLWGITYRELKVRSDLTLGPGGTDNITLAGATGNGTFAGNLVVSGTVTATGGVVGGTSEGTFADGSAAVPSMAFTLDADTGFYRIGANNVGFSIGGTKRWDFGTGTSALTGILTVSGATTVTGALAGNGGFALDTTLFTVADATGVL